MTTGTSRPRAGGWSRPEPAAGSAGPPPPGAATPAAASAAPRSPVPAIRRRAETPSIIPATDPRPPSVRIERISDQIAILLMRWVPGGAYAGPARVRGSDLDIVTPHFVVWLRHLP